MRHGYITNLVLFYPAWSFSQSFRSLSFFQEIVWYPPPFYDWLSISCCLASWSKWFIPGSPLFNLFYSFVPGPVYWYPSQWNSTPNLDIHFWMSNPPLCWRVLFLEWPPPGWGHLLTSLFFLALPFPLFPLPLARTWCVFIFVILKCLIGIVSSLFPRFPQTELFQSFDFSLFTFFLRLWLLLLYRNLSFVIVYQGTKFIGFYHHVRFLKRWRGTAICFFHRRQKPLFEMWVSCHPIYVYIVVPYSKMEWTSTSFHIMQQQSASFRPLQKLPPFWFMSTWWRIFKEFLCFETSLRLCLCFHTLPRRVVVRGSYSSTC